MNYLKWLCYKNGNIIVIESTPQAIRFLVKLKKRRVLKIHLI